MTTAARAKEFIAKVQLGHFARPTLGLTKVDEPFKPVGNKPQAVVVGADVVSFASEVTAERRQDIHDCTLLAQLAANSQVSQDANILVWYDAYFDVLSNLGWIITQREFEKHESHGKEVDVHQAIIAAATLLLGPKTKGLALVISTLTAMETPGTPWITIFKKESQKLQAESFQIAAVEQEASGQTTVSMMAFTLNVSSVTNSIVIFKIQTSDAVLQSCSGRISINEGVLDAIREDLREKVNAHAVGYVGSLKIS